MRIHKSFLPFSALRKNTFKLNSFIPGLLGLLTLLLVQCNSIKPNSSASLKPLPGSFSSKSDSSIAMLNWREYFSDTTLLQLIDTALNNNLDLMITTQRILQAREQVRLHKGNLLPTVNASPSVSQRKFGLYTMDGAGNNTTDILPGRRVPVDLQDYYLGLQASWEVDVWGKLRNKKKAARLRYLASVEGKNWVITNLIAEIASLYYELLALDNELEILKKTIELQENALSIVTIQKEAGETNELAVKQFQSQLLNSKAMEMELSQQIIEVENRLNFLMGRFPQAIIRRPASFRNEIPWQVKVGIPSELLANRTDIKQAEYMLMATNADLKAARAAFYPSFNITGALGYQAFNGAYLFNSPESVAYGLLGNMTAPLINRNAIRAEFRTAKSAQIEAMYQYQKSIIIAFVEVQNQLAGIQNLEKMYALKSQEVDVLTESIETSTELFRTGRANYLEVLMTQRNALISKIELAEAKRRQFDSMINIYRVLGGGWR
jgi:NodT family efflux transporter outer membrane factor (OMF) lipoprotein